MTCEYVLISCAFTLAVRWRSLGFIPKMLASSLPEDLV
jgi:hypothetical protein